MGSKTMIDVGAGQRCDFPLFLVGRPGYTRRAPIERRIDFFFVLSRFRAFSRSGAPAKHTSRPQDAALGKRVADDA